MAKITRLLLAVAILACLTLLSARYLAAQSSNSDDDPDAHPPVTQTDIKIVKRAREILDSPAKWNRADNRACPADAKTFSLYCALEKATNDVTAKFAHRGAAMQEARFVVEELAPGKDYDHRLMDYNNDPATTFADVGKCFDRLEARIAARLNDKKHAGK